MVRMAHPSHVSWPPPKELHRRPQWQNPRGVPIQNPTPKGEPLNDDDHVWENLWYYCIVDPGKTPDHRGRGR